jgi:hypothetical protein
MKLIKTVASVSFRVSHNDKITLIKFQRSDKEKYWQFLQTRSRMKSSTKIRVRTKSAVNDVRMLILVNELECCLLKA